LVPRTPKPGADYWVPGKWTLPVDRGRRWVFLMRRDLMVAISKIHYQFITIC
jgi:hypothetical protein